jgi:hypothetical protein
MAQATKKKPSSKKANGKLWGNDSWTIVGGELTRPRGRPGKVESLFKFVGEKIPFEFLNNVKEYLIKSNIGIKGVYMAHDSKGCPRYIGRGDIFNRLDARRKAQVLELRYFSFFVVKDEIHEREVETIMIRAAGPLLAFNSRKVRDDILAGDVRDFERGTKYIERQYKRGKKVKTKQGST